jgi:hypothetical protein
LSQESSSLNAGRLSAYEQAGISILLVAALIYGFFVECRATLTKDHNTDLGVYLAAAQAVRENGDLYSAKYNSDHYMYPPFLAMVLAHVVPAPPVHSQPASTAFAVTVDLWYILSLLALVATVRILAKTLVRAWPEARAHCQLRWRPYWTLCLLPVAVCLHSLGRELQLGQVDVFVLLFLALMMVSAAEGRSGQAGFWHALAIALKLMPVVLLVYPLWRRDWRWLLACAGGLVVWLFLLPVLMFGFDGTVKYNREYAQVFMIPAITGQATDHSRENDMLNQDAVHNLSILGTLHSLEYISLERHERPKAASPFNRKVAEALAVLLVLMTLLASGFRRQLGRLETVLCLSMLVVLMIIGSPVCQSYYFFLLVPMLMAIVAADLQRSGAASPRPLIWGVLAAFALALAAASFSPFLRDCGAVLASILVLWMVALLALARETQRAPATILPKVPADS